jgi:MinD-like ATPase involved in chromosome partitioning or flagellar assembly
VQPLVSGSDGVTGAAAPVLGLVGRTAAWPQRLATWAAADTSVPRVTYCPSVAHLVAQVQHEHAPVVLLDGDLSVVDRDLLAELTGADGTPIVVQGARRHVDWSALGAAGVLRADFDRPQLLAVASPAPSAGGARPTAPIVAVTGPGGTGASIAAIAIAQGLAGAHRRVLLADCCLRAEQAMLHNTHGSQPNLVDLVELHAGRTPDERQVRQLALGIVERRYYLLPGLPRARQWSRVRAPSLRAALTSLRGAFGLLVVDVDADVEGEAEGGSIEVEERNLLARTLLGDAAVTVVVGQPTMKGVYALVRTVVDLLELGVPPQRVLPVLNQIGPDQQTRADLGRAVRTLIDGVAGGSAVGPALFVPAAALEDVLRERDPLPEALTTALGGAVAALLDRVDGGATSPRAPTPAPVAAGAIGHWSDGV